MRKHWPRAGFTLVEMMIVVAIIAVVAVLAISSYGKYVRRAVTTEAAAMLGEIRAKQEAYQAEAGAYLSTAPDETQIFPALSPAGYTLKNWGMHTPPDPWALLGVNPPRSQLYCGYVAIAGAFNVGPPGHFGNPTGPAGAAILAMVPRDASGNIASPWFYGRACCDLSRPWGPGTCPDSPTDQSVFSISSFDNVWREHNVGQ